MKRRLLSAVVAGAMLITPFAASYSVSAAEITEQAVQDTTNSVEIITEGEYGYVVREDGTVSIEKYTGAGGNVTIPSKLGGKTVTYIGDRAFWLNKNITGVTIPDTVTECAHFAFAHCEKLESVNIGKGMKELYFTFSDSKSLKQVTIPGNVEMIRYAFNDCPSLETAIMQEGVKTIDYNAFFNCPALKKVVIPASVDTIDSDAFAESKNVTIYGKSGSYAETFAKEHNIPFVADGTSAPTPEPKTEPVVLPDSNTGIKGDLDGDSRITSSDALIILRSSASLVILGDKSKKLADVDGDNQITSADAVHVLRYSIGMSSNLGIGKTM